MSKYYYHKKKPKKIKKAFRFLALILFLVGLSIFSYIFFPLISWQIFFSPVFASYNIKAPIPKVTILDNLSLSSLIGEASNRIKNDSYDAQNWFPSYKGKRVSNRISSYSLSIPKLGINNAVVSTQNNTLSKNLVNYQGTAVPPEKGNAVIYGHSSLPQLFDPTNYKTIFATLHNLKISDEFYITTENITYKYVIFNIIIVDPSDTSIFVQEYDNSYVTLVTCTPPGTTWKRLIIKAKLEKI